MRTARKPSPILAADTFGARCEARALLFAAGEIELQEAVDGLWADAEANGLVDALGVDAVQRILSDEFAKVRP